MREIKTPSRIPQIRLCQHWLHDQRGLSFDTYDALWRWSTTDLDAFWQSHPGLFRHAVFYGAQRGAGPQRQPGAQWFRGAQVSCAAQVLRHVDAAPAPSVPQAARRVRRECPG